MPRAEKLPSGSWRCRVYSHSELTIDPKTGKEKKKAVYQSFFSDDQTARGRREVEAAASAFLANKPYQGQDKGCYTLGQAIDKYIALKEAVGKSPTTIYEYKCTREHAFQDIMDIRLKDLNKDILQDAVNREAGRPSARRTKNPKPISAKRLKNEWTLLAAVIHEYFPRLDISKIELPKVQLRHVELPTASSVMSLVAGSEIELPVLLAMWLSFTMSEIRGLTKSGSISADGNYIMIDQVMVTISGRSVAKPDAKNEQRNRRHRIPKYIKGLIDQVEGDVLVPMTAAALSQRWYHMQKGAGMKPITFHDLRHLNASVMALLRVPDKYAQERGGWKSDYVMKRVYMTTFSDERERVDDLIDAYFENEQVRHKSMIAGQ